MEPPSQSRFQWLRTGVEAMTEMLSAIATATHSVRLEVYIYHPGPIADQFREALVNACQRGLKVQVLLDALGSYGLPETYWDKLKISGGEFRFFNPLRLTRFGFRDHRKSLVCDEQVAFVGGFNVADEYYGDGVRSGWRDLGIKVEGAAALELAHAFDEMFASADFVYQPFTSLRKSARLKTVSLPEARLLLSRPGRNNPLKKSLRKDLCRARNIQMVCAYFLPTWRIRRELMRAARRGAKVQLILPGKTDVPISRLAAQSFYRRLLSAGVEIYEYQPQILHAKALLIDNIVYVGSSNLDARSLHINYELLLRIPDRNLAAQGRAIFRQDLSHCRRIELSEWKKTQSFWPQIKARLAYLVLARLDPLVARYQWRMLRAKTLPRPPAPP